MTSREKILGKLRAARAPFPDVAPPTVPLAVTPLEGASRADLVERFVAEATKVLATVYQPTTEAEAVQTVLRVIGDDAAVMTWDQLPLAGVQAALVAQGTQVIPVPDATVRVGVTGVRAALAATGSLILTSGAGRARAASLLPPVHIALVRTGQILPTFEAWVAQQRAEGLATFRNTANTVLITGPSRTADIAMELILGMHGPREVHIVLCP